MKEKKENEKILAGFYHKKYNKTASALEIWQDKLNAVIDGFMSLGDFKPLTESEFKSFFTGNPDEPNKENIENIMLSKILNGQKLEIAGIKLKISALDMELPSTEKLIMQIKGLPFRIHFHDWTAFNFTKGKVQINKDYLVSFKENNCSYYAETPEAIVRLKLANTLIKSALAVSSNLKDFKSGALIEYEG